MVPLSHIYSSPFYYITMQELTWFSTPGVSFYMSTDNDIFMSASDLAMFISLHLNKEFNFTSIKNATKLAVSRGHISEPVTRKVPTKYGQRDMPLYDNKACCFFIRKFAPQTTLVQDCMECSFTAYANALYLTLAKKAEESLSPA